MLEQAYLAIAGSVAMHVAWNLLVRHQGAQTRMLWWALAAHCATLGLWGLVALASEAHWSRELVGLLLISAGANTLYFLALNRAYEHAPVALVYPIVRSSPLLIGVWSVLFFGESLGVSAWVAMWVRVKYSSKNRACQSEGRFVRRTCTAVTLYSGQFVAQSELSVVTTFAPDSG